MRLGNWLTAEKGQAFWQAPDHERVEGKQTLLASGLRRHELAG